VLAVAAQECQQRRRNTACTVTTPVDCGREQEWYYAVACHLALAANLAPACQHGVDLSSPLLLQLAESQRPRSAAYKLGTLPRWCEFKAGLGGGPAQPMLVNSR
jgi:hypothetical protein